MATLQQRASFEDQYVTFIQEQISTQIKGGQFTSVPRSWQDLHDQVDANYGNLLDDDEWSKFCANYDGATTEATDGLERINARVEAWLLTL